MADQFDLECRDVVKKFGQFTAVDQVSLTIPQGSFFSILGPSGCGKTTLLRMLAGFIEPTAGDILIKGKSVLGVAPNRRPVNMVFQHLALFPMMNVAQNVAYGLRRRGVGRATIDKKVAETLARVGLPDSGQKQISQLSGGQKQRIAIARCLVLEPAVLLLDEPLGALDLKLREHMKVELKQLQHEIGTTFVYITHDQSEALVMSDQVAVMNAGRFEQVGTPQELYYQPDTPFVAGFVGESNRWQGTFETVADGKAIIRLDSGGVIYTDPTQVTNPDLVAGQRMDVFVRPEAITIAAKGQGPVATSGLNAMQGRVENLLFNGAASSVQLRETTTGHEMNVALPQTGAFAGLRNGDELDLSWSAGQTKCFPNTKPAQADASGEAVA
ncbi:ABC transporter ATP-binding protein [Thalassospira sp. MCCC 1A01428]|uniref:ABC transporter ATP-binding protein n=1 Tax=Thalassospira sp. MCCC 1A01428 TaxID=1470575 RepID=UPI000A1E235E|nr:ABC transporter ATP-binding protein [Thalassospira sp. MCCC 1A01428]OSQ41238.1 spermidine/putrescine ABC transporter ATP-binding protein [Thalassospira sp. MCCC 1A01428]